MTKAYDAVIVGGGASGALVGRVLFDRGMNVLVLEAGERTARLDVDPMLWAYETEGEPFEWTRVRALGGRTLLWGGWSSRATATSLEDAARAGVPFPFPIDELLPHYADVEALLGVEEEALSDGFAAIRDSLKLDVVAKRTANAGGRPTTGADLLEGVPVRTNAIVTRVRAKNGRASAVVLQDETIIEARHVVIAASAIETARLLLESADTGVPNPTERIGFGLVDHMVASALLLDSSRALPSSSALVPRFVRREYIGGFVTEVTGPQPASALTADQRRILEIDEDAAHALSFYAIHAMGPTLPSEARVTLGTARDALGRRVPRIHITLTDNDRAMARDMEETCVAVADAMARPGGKVVPFAMPLGSRAGHEAGTCRMGTDEAAPVDSDGRLRGLENVWIVDASILPHALDVHPTLTLLAIAARTARNIR